MCKLNKKSGLKRIDPCMRLLVGFLKGYGIPIVACCCGHGKYPMTIVIQDKERSVTYEIISGEFIPRKKKFYKKDKQGYYYIPEVGESNGS